MKYGLPQKTINEIIECLTANDNVEQAILYGSRAKGNFRNGSDVDLALKGLNLSLKDVYRIEDGLDNLLLPYETDISIYHQIENPDLIEHINRVGIVFYKAEKTLFHS